MKNYYILFISILLSSVSFAQNGSIHFREHQGYKRPDARKELMFPDIMGYRTLKCDFHIHTDYSDGMVNPEERVREAWREGLNAIAITDHNWLPAFYGEDMNESFDRAYKEGLKQGITVIHGVEYTCSKPVGHLNFLFIKDSNIYHYDRIKPDKAVETAAEEGAFVIYNHPGWPDHDSTLSEFQKQYLKKGYIHAMEIFNAGEFYPIAIDYVNEYGIASIGGSDIHAPIHQIYYLDKAPRTMTLVFADDNSEESIRDALFSKRTLAYADGNLAGDEKYIEAMLDASIRISDVVVDNGMVKFNVLNTSCMTFYLRNPACFMITLPAQSEVSVRLSEDQISYFFDVLNCHVGADKFFQFSFEEYIDL